jgi:hypothetical protein
MAIQRCGWCGKTLGIAPAVDGEETTGMCESCEARVTAEAALAHALVGLRALAKDARKFYDEIATIALEVERARIGIWPQREEKP